MKCECLKGVQGKYLLMPFSWQSALADCTLLFQCGCLCKAVLLMQSVVAHSSQALALA